MSLVTNVDVCLVWYQYHVSKLHYVESFLAEWCSIFVLVHLHVPDTLIFAFVGVCGMVRGEIRIIAQSAPHAIIPLQWKMDKWKPERLSQFSHLTDLLFISYKLAKITNLLCVLHIDHFSLIWLAFFNWWKDQIHYLFRELLFKRTNWNLF